MNINILISPIITEQSMKDAKNKKFTFRVDKTASKHGIKKAIEKKFKVTVVSIATNLVKGKTKRSGKRRIEANVAPFKKALIKLLPNQSIDLFEQTTK